MNEPGSADRAATQRPAASSRTAVFDALPMHVALLDARGRIVAVNAAWRRFGAANGLRDAEFGVGTDYAGFCEAVDGPDAAEAKAAARGMRAVLAGEVGEFSLEYACHSPDERRWYRMMVAPLDASGASGVAVVHIDISERVRSENALRDSDRRYRGIVEVLPDLVFTVVDGRITFVNEAGLRLLRAREAAGVLGRSPLEFFPAPGPPALRQHLLDRADAGEGDGSPEARLLTLDGSEVDVELTTTSYGADSRRVLQVVCRDLSERRQAERQRQQLADRLASTLEGLSDGFCTLDRAWCFTYVNAAAETLLARPRAELLGQVAWSLFPGSAGSAIGQALQRAMAEREAVQLVERYPPHERWLDLRIYGSAQGVAVYARDVTRERRLATQLEEERSRLVEAQAVARMGSWGTDLQTGRVHWSAETHRIFETDARDFQPTHERFLERVHPDDRAAVDAAFLASFDRPVPQTLEHRLLMPDGRIKTVEERWQVFRDAAGAPVRALGTCQDVTERKRAEQELRRSEALVDLAGHMARLGAWSVELDTMAVHWSDVVASIHGEPAGYQPALDKALGYFPPAHRDVVWAAFSRCVDEGRPFDLETQLISAAGQPRWVRLLGEPERDDAGKVVRVRGAIQDVSERKAAEQATRELAERLQTTLESITDGFFTLDGDWRFTYLNRQAERLLGRSRESLLGRSMWDEYPEAVGSPAQAQYGRALREQVAVTFEYAYPPLQKWFEVHAYPSSQGLAVYFRDVSDRKRDQDALRELNAQLEARVEARTTELRRAREEAEQASRAKSAFLATMSHEIRTPMNGVIGMIDVLQQTRLDGDQVEMVDLIRESAHSLLGIIEDILDFSRIEAGRMDIERSPLRLAELVKAVCGMLAHLAVKRDVRMTLHIDPTIPALLVGDEARLRQVLVNLIGNAIKFCGGLDRPGRVAVRADLRASDGGSATFALSVADNGIGMDEATMARLFTPFTQGDASTTRRFGGSGLGLAISGTLVQLMGGAIEVRSAPGQGATFTVTLTLPRAEGQAPVEPAVAQAADAVEGQRGDAARPAEPSGLPRRRLPAGRRILVAEDNETNRSVVRAQLHLSGVDAVFAEDGRQALELWRSGDFALLFTDLHMPRLDGYALARAIRADEQARGTRRTAIVALTANALRDEEQRCRAAGMDGYLSKPVRLARLREAIARWLPLAHGDAAPKPMSGGGPDEPDAPAVAPAPPVDLGVLTALVGDDEAVVAEVLRAFRDSASAAAAELDRAFGAGHWRDVADVAHRLKSGARSIGARQLGERCSELEEAAEAGHPEAVDVLMGRLESDLYDVLAWLEHR